MLFADSLKSWSANLRHFEQFREMHPGLCVSIPGGRRRNRRLQPPDDLPDLLEGLVWGLDSGIGNGEGLLGISRGRRHEWAAPAEWSRVIVSA